MPLFTVRVAPSQRMRFTVLFSPLISTRFLEIVTFPVTTYQPSRQTRSVVTVLYLSGCFASGVAMVPLTVWSM